MGRKLAEMLAHRPLDGCGRQDPQGPLVPLGGQRLVGGSWLVGVCSDTLLNDFRMGMLLCGEQNQRQSLDFANCYFDRWNDGVTP